MKEYRRGSDPETENLKKYGRGRRCAGNSRKRKKKRATAVLGFFMTLFIAGGMAAVLFLMGRMGKVSPVSASVKSEGYSEADKSIVVSAGEEGGSVHNLLLIGQDARAGESGQRSDSMILCSIDTKENKMQLISLMRDMYVQIPGYKKNKLNAAYAFGGMELLDKTIALNFGIPVDGNVEVDFEGFLKALTEVGNLDMDLTYEEATYMNANEGLGSANDDVPTDEAWGLKEGMNSLTPEQALCYSRMRYVGNSDYDRVERQKKVIMAAYQKAQSLGVMKKMALAAKILPYVSTDLTNQELLKYTKILSENKMNGIETHRIPVDGTFSEEYVDEMAVLIPDLTANKAYLRNYLYHEALPEETYKDGASRSDLPEVLSGDDVNDSSYINMEEPGVSDVNRYNEEETQQSDEEYGENRYQDGEGVSYAEDDDSVSYESGD